MCVSLIEDNLKSEFYNILYTAYNKHFAYHSVIQKSARLRVNIKVIASKLTLPFLNKARPNKCK